MVGKERVCCAEEIACSKISAGDNGDDILGLEVHDSHTLLPSWTNCEYGLLQKSDHTVKSVKSLVKQNIK